MKINLYYPPYPAQIFKGSKDPVNPVRPFNPKSALPTLASGIRYFSRTMKFNCDIEIIDLQVGGKLTYYKSIPYGLQTLLVIGGTDATARPNKNNCMAGR